MKCKHCNRDIQGNKSGSSWRTINGYVGPNGSIWYYQCDGSPNRKPEDNPHEPEEKEDHFDRMYLKLKAND